MAGLIRASFAAVGVALVAAAVGVAVVAVAAVSVAVVLLLLLLDPLVDVVAAVVVVSRWCMARGDA